MKVLDVPSDALLMLIFGADAGTDGLEQAVSLGGTMRPLIALPPPAQQG
jgi:hypothetical protein